MTIVHITCIQKNFYDYKKKTNFFRGNADVLMNANINRISVRFGKKKKRLSTTQCVLKCTTRIIRAAKVYGI